MSTVRNELSVSVKAILTKWSSTAPFALGQDLKGVLAGPGTPRGPKSHLFATNWVAIQPFCTSLRPADAEFRRGSRQIGLRSNPLNLNFCFAIFWVKNAPNRETFRLLTPFREGPQTVATGVRKNTQHQL